MSNENLRLARQVKNDEFYTRYEDIEKELIKYKEQFKGKIVYCNCDAPESNFVKFFNDVRKSSYSQTERIRSLVTRYGGLICL